MCIRDSDHVGCVPISRIIEATGGGLLIDYPPKSAFVNTMLRMALLLLAARWATANRSDLSNTHACQNINCTRRQRLMTGKWRQRRLSKLIQAPATESWK